MPAKPKEFGTVANVQINHFSDASEVGYGTVSYLRVINAESKVHCSFAMSKTCLAPLSHCHPMKGRVTVDEMLIVEQEVLRFIQKKAKSLS